ncbi:MAG: transglutaminase domain-containing protein [Alloprevotella sp.]
MSHQSLREGNVKTYAFEFLTECRFSPDVQRHSFKLRVEPMDCACQQTLESSVELTPATTLNRATDSFGNRIIFGLIEPPHDRFIVCSKGIVGCRPYVIPDAAPAEVYRYPTPLTHWDADLLQLAKGLTPAEIMEAVHGRMVYERFLTSNTTSAIDAFRLGKGVCQDFAHVMLAACRSVGMLARYVNGMVTGEGETHAWVEVFRNGCWLGYDPTFNRTTDEGYIKVAHGRDTNDCPVNRGRFFNRTTEQMTVKCKVTHDTNSDLS